MHALAPIDCFDVLRFGGIVETHHWRYVQDTRDEFVADPRRVYELGHRLATMLRRARPRDPMARDLLTERHVLFASYACLGAYAFERYGLDYVQLCRASDKGVADLVREMSGDPREDVGCRRKLLQMRISGCSELAQLVRFCELAATARALRGLADADPGWLTAKAWTGQPNHYELGSWVDHAVELTRAMGGGLFAGEAFPVLRAKFADLLADLYSRSKVRQARRAARERARREAEAAAAEDPAPPAPGADVDAA